MGIYSVFMVDTAIDDLEIDWDATLSIHAIYLSLSP